MLMKSDPIDSSASYIDYYINSNHNHPQEDKFVKTTKTTTTAHVQQFFVPREIPKWIRRHISANAL